MQFNNKRNQSCTVRPCATIITAETSTLIIKLYIVPFFNFSACVIKKSLESIFSTSAAIVLNCFFQSILASLQLQTSSLLVLTVSYELTPTFKHTNCRWQAVTVLPVQTCWILPGIEWSIAVGGSYSYVKRLAAMLRTPTLTLKRRRGKKNFARFARIPLESPFLKSWIRPCSV